MCEKSNRYMMMMMMRMATLSQYIPWLGTHQRLVGKQMKTS